jgi:hypothetical protein
MKRRQPDVPLIYAPNRVSCSRDRVGNRRYCARALAS